MFQKMKETRDNGVGRDVGEGRWWWRQYTVVLEGKAVTMVEAFQRDR